MNIFKQILKAIKAFFNGAQASVAAAAVAAACVVAVVAAMFVAAASDVAVKVAGVVDGYIAYCVRMAVKARESVGGALLIILVYSIFASAAQAAFAAGGWFLYVVYVLCAVPYCVGAACAILEFFVYADKVVFDAWEKMIIARSA